MNFFNNNPPFPNGQIPIYPEQPLMNNNINTKINELELRIKKLEQRISLLETNNNNQSFTEPDNSLYMI
jgi:hypothetical protein